MKKTLIGALLSATFLAACGGGGGSSSDTTGGQPAAQQPAVQAGTSKGILTDSPVGGVQYVTSGGYTGVTAADGSFAYNPGDQVTFRIGNIVLGTVTATPTVTPLVLAAAETNKENVTTNLLVLLQSLDADGDPSNGISINSATRTAAAAANVDLTIAPTTFASSANTALVTVMSTGSVARTSPVSEADALAHFEEQFLKDLSGSWIFEDASGAVIIRFDSNGNYILGEAAPADSDGSSGTEVGRIDWDPKTGKVTLAANSLVYDSNGAWGLDQVNGSEVLRINGDILTMTDADGTVTNFNRIKRDATLPLIGTWTLNSSNVNTQTITFLGNGKFLTADPIGDETCESNGGIEYGNYSYNTSTRLLSVTTAAQYDTNSCAGLWNSSDYIEGSSLTFNFDSANDVITFIADNDTEMKLYRVSK